MASSESAEGRTVISKVATILMAYLYGESHSLTELTAVCDLPSSTTHRLVNELAHCKILDRADSGEYRVGIPVRKIGASKRCAIDLEEQSHFALQDLSYTLDVAVRLGVLHGGEVAYVEKLTGRRPVTGFQEARHLPAHATALGKALLAFSPQQTVHAILLRGLTAFTPYTLATPERFRRALGNNSVLQPTSPSLIESSQSARARLQSPCSTRSVRQLLPLKSLWTIRFLRSQPSDPLSISLAAACLGNSDTRR